MGKKIIPRGSSMELAKLLGITDRRVRQLTDNSILTRQPEGDFILPEAIEDYYAYKYQTEESVDLMAEKALHEKAKRELAELELARRRNEVHSSEDVEMVMSDMLTRLRSQMLGVPAKMAAVLANRDKAYIEHSLMEEIHSRLTELSEYSPTMFTEVAADAEKDD